MRKPIAVDLDDLNERIVLAYTGEPRNSGINNWEVMKAHIDGDKAVHRNFDHIAAIACAMRSALEKADWNEVARLLREEWAHRKKNAPGISTPLIDRLVDATKGRERRAPKFAARAAAAVSSSWWSAAPKSAFPTSFEARVPRSCPSRLRRAESRCEPPSGDESFRLPSAAILNSIDAIGRPAQVCPRVKRTSTACELQRAPGRHSDAHER